MDDPIPGALREFPDRKDQAGILARLLGPCPNVSTDPGVLAGLDQVEQAWSDANAANAADRYRSKQREHRGHHIKKFHVNLLFNEHRLVPQGMSVRSVQRIPPGRCRIAHAARAAQMGWQWNRAAHCCLEPQL
jgi:hypothetical protein